MANKKKIKLRGFNFSKLSNSEIIASFNRLASTQFPANRMLTPRNRYYTKSIDRINYDIKKSVLTDPKKRGLKDYIAASILTHYSDAWTYFSKSVLGVLNGCHKTAIHLSYYSELRSTMAIMASQGFGIFSRQHFWTDKMGQLKNLNGPTTHQTADFLIRNWAKRPREQRFILDNLTANNFSFSNWIAAANGSPSSAISRDLLTSWLKKWSIDIDLEHDQDIRNEQSYRPKFDIEGFHSGITLLKISNLWRAAQPTTIGKFSELDKHLLRSALNNSFKFQHGGQELRGNVKSKKYIEDIYKNLGLSLDSTLFPFLTFQNDPDTHWILEVAEKDVTDTDGKLDSFPILCRAFLLLRLATASVNGFLNSTNIAIHKKDRLNFWMNNICKTSGFSLLDDDESDSSDLYLDIEDILNNSDWSTLVANESLEENRRDHSDIYNIIHQFERAIFWGLCL